MLLPLKINIAAAGHSTKGWGRLLYVPPQAGSTHALVSVSEPGQVAPKHSRLGLVQVRVRFLTPSPQVLSHAAKLVHSVQPPSTASGHKTKEINAQNNNSNNNEKHRPISPNNVFKCVHQCRMVLDSPNQAFKKSSIFYNLHFFTRL